MINNKLNKGDNKMENKIDFLAPINFKKCDSAHDERQHEADCLHDNGFHAEAKKIETDIFNNKLNKGE